MSASAEILWEPVRLPDSTTVVGRFVDRLARERGIAVGGYDDLWRWSVGDLEGFWAAVWEFFGVRAATRYERVLASGEMPGARWFEGATLNYAEHALRGPNSGGQAAHTAPRLAVARKATSVSGMFGM